MPMPVVQQRSRESLVGELKAQRLGASLFCCLIAGVMCALSTQVGAVEFSAEVDRLARAQTQGIRLDHGRAVIPCPLQRVEAVVDSSGLVVRSVSSDEGEGAFSLRVRVLGRIAGPATVPGPGLVSATSSLAKLTRSGMVEEFSTSADGLRQDFVVLQSPPGSGMLVLDVGVDGATAAADGQGVSLQLESGRRLVYHRLRVTDATGRELAATMQARCATAIRIEVQDADAAYPVRIDPTITDADWVSMSEYAGANNDVACIVYHGGDMYVGGYFTAIQDTMANRIAKWDGSSWSALGTGLNSKVAGIAFDGSGNLYAGGTFTTAGGSPANRVAKWDGSSWSSLGTGLNSEVTALAFDADGDLYVGGQFSVAGGVSANRIAKWNGTAWSALGSGVGSGFVSALACDTSGTLYAGGQFSAIDGVDVNNVAKWDDGSWSALGTGLSTRVYALALDASGKLHAGASNRVASWDGTSWTRLGTGMNNAVSSLAFDGSGNLYAGGYFTYAGGNAANRIAKWDGTAWSALGTGLGSYVLAVACDASGNVYAGGDFTTAGGEPANYIAKWDASSWSTFGAGMDGDVLALARDGSGKLYAGGEFTTMPGGPANYVAEWDGTSWSALGTGMSGKVKALACDPSGNLYAGGEFTTAGGVTVNRIAKWDGANWTALGSGTNHHVVALACDSAGNLYAGGHFTTVDGISANRIAKWDGANWSALGDGVNNSVYSLAVTTAGDLYVGGSFTTAGGETVNRIAKWDGNAWSGFATGVGANVYALTIDRGGDLCVGGAFTAAGGALAYRVARWDGSAWSPLGSGLGSEVYAMGIAATGELFAAGNFTSSGGVPMNRIARWNGTSWDALGTALSRRAYALAFDQAGALYVGGEFTTAGGKVSPYLAKCWIPSSPTAVADTYETYRNAPLVVAAPGVLANDTNLGGGALTATKIDDPTHGTVSLASDGSFTYTSTAGYAGIDSFTYQASNTTGDSDAVTVTITVTNRAPAATNDAYVTVQSTALNVLAPGVLANDGDPDSDPLNATKVSDPSNGALTLYADGGFTYTPNAGFSGTDSFTYQANDGLADSTVTTVQITVTSTHVVDFVLDPHGTHTGGALSQTVVHGEAAVAPEFTVAAGWTFTGWDVAFADVTGDLAVTAQYNAVPVAIDDSHSMLQDTALVVALPGVLGNDTDGEGDPLTATKVTDPAHGTVALAADGSFTYTPTAGYHGADSFTYKANDGHADSPPATVSVTVLETHAVTFDLGAHGTRTGGGSLAQTVVDGEAAMAPEFMVVAGWTFTGWDVAFANVTGDLAVTAQYNAVPVAVADSHSMLQDTALVVALPGVLGNDTDGEGDPLTATKVTDPAHGTVALAADGSFTYTPTAGYHGADSFTYKANDGHADSPPATVSVTVLETHAVTFDLGAHGTRTGGGALAQTVIDGEAAVAPEFTVAAGWTFTGWDVAFADVTGDLAVTAQYSAVPVAVADSHSMLQDTALVVAPPGVLGNDTDAEGDALTATKVTDPGHGTVALAADGSFTYTPTAGYHGADSFTYQANDGHADSASAAVAITVLETHAVTFDLDPCGTRTGGGSLAQTVVDGEAAVAPEFTVAAGWTSTGWDVAFASVTGDLAVTAQYNAVPVAVADSHSMLQDAALVVAAPGVLGNDTDAEGDALTATKVTDPGHGTVALAADGSFTYTPTAGYHGADSFTYQANDGHADSASAAVAITVLETHAVTFDLDPYGTRTGGGALAQTVIDGEAAVAPEFTVAAGWTFTGWDVAFADVTGDLAVTAQYNAVPVAIDDSHSMLQDTALVVALPGVLGNDTDGEGDSLTASKVDDPTHGTLTFHSHGGFTYTPVATFSGIDSFTYQANDGLADSPVATVEITVKQTHVVEFVLAPHGNRTGGGALVQTVVHGTAALAPEFTVAYGMTFTGWDTSFATIAAGLTVTAGYAETTYALTVENGTGTGAYTEGTEITVTADEAPAGKEFAGWTVAPVDCAANLSSALSSAATLTMPGKAVTLIATYAYTAPEWTVDLTLTDATPATLTFGMRGDATDGWDDGVDVQYPLPAFGQACLAAADLALSYSTDLHAPAETGEFLLIAKAGFADLTIAWDVSGLPGGKFMTIYEVLLDHVTPERGPVARTLVGNTALDLGLAESLTVPAGETRSYVIRYGDELVFDLLFAPGWNTVSLPIEPVSPAVANVLDDSQAQDSRGALRATISRAQVWEWQGSSYAVAAEMHACIGYWIYVAEGAVLLVQGTPVDQVALGLSRGWNLCGTTTSRPMPADPRLIGAPWGWNGASLRYTPTTSLIPGLAYWINTAEDCVIPFAAD